MKKKKIICFIKKVAGCSRNASLVITGIAPQDGEIEKRVRSNIRAANAKTVMVFFLPLFSNFTIWTLPKKNSTGPK